jgi:alginate O-acetyltransferase complex protein AlgI
LFGAAIERVGLMLFNSVEFIFVFMPIVFGGFAILQRFNRPEPIILWLLAASYLFYSWLEPSTGLLLGSSTAVNWMLGWTILRQRRLGRARAIRWLMWLGIVFDLGLLGFFKYTNFFVTNVGTLADIFPVPNIALPIGISFYTFTQIAYLVDAARGKINSTRVSDYALFVSYYPHLVAGPILNHGSTLPQIGKLGIKPRDIVLVAAGLSLFAFGLAKKTLIADAVAPIADSIFGKAVNESVGAIDGWCGALAYTFQIYFDFSGYSDMAVGLSLLFGIRLPLNFASPYKSTSIAEFWQRWHMSLSAFLRDYLYIPLGGNREGQLRRYFNLMVTMLLGGLWHGAGWTFVAWGALHGVYLVVYHLFRSVWPSHNYRKNRLYLVWGKRLVVFALVVVAWVPFRADSFGAAAQMMKGMAGLSGIGSVDKPFTSASWITVCLLIVWFLPNSYEIFETIRPTLAPRADLVQKAPAWLTWRPVSVWSIIAASVLVVGILSITQFSPFLYFRF